MKNLQEFKKAQNKKELIQEYVNLNIDSVRNMPSIPVSDWEWLVKSQLNNKSITEIKKDIKISRSLISICSKNTNN